MKNTFLLSIVGLLLTIAGAATGYGWNRSAALDQWSTQITRNTAVIVTMQQADSEFRVELRETKESQRQAMKAVADMFTANMNLNRELMGILREQAAINRMQADVLNSLKNKP